MRRREFIAGLGSAVAWPLAARAQQAAMPVIGSLDSMSNEYGTVVLPGFRSGLKELGYVEGQNVAIDYRWADMKGTNRLAALAAELIAKKEDAILATGGPA